MREVTLWLHYYTEITLSLHLPTGSKQRAGGLSGSVCIGVATASTNRKFSILWRMHLRASTKLKNSGFKWVRSGYARALRRQPKVTQSIQAGDAPQVLRREQQLLNSGPALGSRQETAHCMGAAFNTLSMRAASLGQRLRR